MAASWETPKGVVNYMLLGVGVVTLALQVWMVAEAVKLLPRAQGVLEEALKPLPPKATNATVDGGRSC